MNNKKRILFIHNEDTLSKIIIQLLNKEDYLVESSKNNFQILDSIYNNPPDLLIIDLATNPDKNSQICWELKKDNLYKHLPIIAILNKEKEIDWNNLFIDDYVALPLNPQSIINRIRLSFSKGFRELDTNPLSLLPGNNSITKEIQKRLDNYEKIALGYVDIDHFKSYNDRYGFSRGDEVLKMTARLLTNIIRGRELFGTYLGHIGGDDFIFMIPIEKVDTICKEIINNFDIIIPNFYDEEERLKKWIETTNRKGEIEKFDFMSLTIAIVTNEDKRFTHFGEMSAIAAVLKKQGKLKSGSKFVMDLRKKP